MGVQGLWQVLEPAGRPVNVQTLRGKTLAVDASIWLHQLVKGFRDKDGNPLPNAHLLGVFYRVCKLLSYGIKPIFVFDGGVPILKRQTLAGRRQRKLEAQDKSELSRQKMLSNYIRQQLQLQTKKALPPTLQLESEMDKFKSNSSSSTKSNNISPTKKSRFDDVDQELSQFREKFALQIEPDVDRVDRIGAVQNNSSEDDDEDSSEDERSKRYGFNYHDNFSSIASKDFDTLPLEMQHEILSEMQESKKMNSWGKMDKMPQKLQDFSSFQMDRLVKRRFLQKKIQSVQQEMGQRHIHVQNLDELLKMEYNFDEDAVVGSQDKGLVLVKKNTKTKTTSEGDSQEEPTTSSRKCDLKDSDASDSDSSLAEETSKIQTKAVIQSIPEMEEEEQIELAIKLSLDVNKEIYLDSIKSPSKYDTTDNSVCSQNSAPTPSTSAFTLLSDASSCDKHLDSVECSSKETFSHPSNADNSCSKEHNHSMIQTPLTSDSDSDDFEAVECETQDTSTTTAEATMVNELLRKADLTQDPSFAVTTINLTKVISEVPSDDIFADIFEEKPEILFDKNTCEIGSVSQVNGVSSQKTEEKDETEWGLDDELIVALAESVESKTSNAIENILEPVAHSSTVSGGITQSKDNQTINRTLGKPSGSGVTMITAEFMQSQEKLNAEQRRLQSEKGFQERVATSISDQMSLETQELLALFGIPYIISPMEAESQCAFLDAACLTDGTITDDSDCWLFGSLRVYKNFYSGGNKQIEFYQLADIIKILNLDREKLVLIAMLSGGDYSDGIEGVGPVTALEILTEFGTKNNNAFETLQHFRDWWDAINETNDKIPDLPKIREKLRKLKLRPGFPNEAVYQAYINPTIDTSTERFHWGNPDLDAIRVYVQKKFGWDSTKCDSMLLPIVKSTCTSDKSKQLTLDGFFVPSRFDLEKPFKRKRGSKRLHAAFKKLKQTAPPVHLNLSSESSSDEEIFQQSKSADKQGSSSNSTTGESPVKTNTSHVRLPKKASTIPQKVQSETRMNINKQKAIEILKKKRE